jgi:hypothetical protein
MPLGIVLIGGGALLLWGAFTGEHPWNPVVTAFGGSPLPNPGGAGGGAGAPLAPVARDAGQAFGDALAGRATLTARQVADLARQVGFTGAQVPAMVAIAYRESRWQPGAVNAESGATGLWQIYPGGEALKDPLANATAARRKFLASQAAGYSGYRPWASSQPAGSPF